MLVFWSTSACNRTCQKVNLKSQRKGSVTPDPVPCSAVWHRIRCESGDTFAPYRTVSYRAGSDNRTWMLRLHDCGGSVCQFHSNVNLAAVESSFCFEKILAWNAKLSTVDICSPFWHNFYIFIFIHQTGSIYKYTKINNKIHNTVNYKEYIENLTKYYMFQLQIAKTVHWVINNYTHII